MPKADISGQPIKVAIGLHLNPLTHEPPLTTLSENAMKRLALVIVVLSSLAGCIVAPLPPPGPAPGYRGHDRDGDGVRNRYDRRPNNPYRY